MMNLNKKGFTLVELIATIVIMGFISLMAFPSINNAINANKTSACKYYEKTIILSAKSYVQKESVDMLENNNINYRLTNLGYKLTAKDLIDAGYLEPYKDNNSQINTTASGAYVMVKLNQETDTYTYNVKLECKNNNGKVIYSK